MLQLEGGRSSAEGARNEARRRRCRGGRAWGADVPLPTEGVWGEGSAPSPKIFWIYVNVEIPYFRGILVLTVKSQRATFGILGGGHAPLTSP